MNVQEKLNVREIRKGDLVQIVPCYYECFKLKTGKKRGSWTFWEIVPTFVTEYGSVRRYVTAWGQVGSRGSFKERKASSVYEINDLIRSKISKGYVHKEGYVRDARLTFWDRVQPEGFKIGDVGLVIQTERRWSGPAATLLVNGNLLKFPIQYLIPIDDQEEL